MHIILYILDALRVDHLSCYGYERETCPHIATLAQDGVIFENCFTSTTWTRPVAASILTGTYPGVHLTYSRQEMFSTNLTRLPQVLRSNGFKTAAFSTMGNIASEVGFDEGFDQYFDLFRDPIILAKRRRLDSAKEGLLHAPDQEIALPRAEDINDFLFPWLDKHQAANTFSFIWCIETHVPYKAPEEFRRFSTLSPLRLNEGERDDIRSAGATDRQRLMNLYDDEIYYNDYCIGQIMNYLKSLGIYDDTFFIVASDHGDAFYEHGTYAHGHAPYEELIHVPMIMKFPGGEFSRQRIAGLVELVDIFPTVVAVTRPAPSTAERTFVQGYNLLPLLNGTRKETREYVFSDTQSLDIGNRYLSVRSRRWKYIQVQRPKRNRRALLRIARHVIKRHIFFDILRNPHHFMRHYLRNSNQYLFDLETDPGEQHDLAAERPDLVSKFQDVLTRWQHENDELAQQVGSLPYSYEESETLRRHLEALGYM